MNRDPRQRDRRYMGWIARLPCVSCMARTGRVRWGVQVAHCRAAYPEEGWRQVGKGEKPHDWRTTPLCVDCHLNGRHAQHKSNEEAWWSDLGIYPPDLCAALRVEYDAGRSGVAVISKFAAAARRNLEGALMNEDQVRRHYAALQASDELPKQALSIKQPWSWLIVNGFKDIENRDWLKRYPPRILVHAGQQVDVEAHSALIRGMHPVNGGSLPAGMQAAYAASCVYTDKGYRPRELGGFVGVVDITGVQEDHDSPWFMGDYGYILANAKPLPFLPWRGQLGFFDAKVAA